MLLVKKGGGFNYFVSLIVLLIIIAVLAAFAFMLAVSLPGTFASPPLSYEIKEIYNFEPWDFKLDGLSASYPEGGLILPLYRQEKQEAVIILGSGELKSAGQPLPDENPAGVFLVINEKAFEEIRGSVIFMPVDDAKTRLKLEHIYEQQPGLPLLWQKMIPITFVPSGSSSYYYFLSPDGIPLLPPVLNDPPRNLYASLILYALLIIVILLVMTIFSLDYRPSRYWENLYHTRPGKKTLGLAAVAAILALGGELLPVLKGWPEYTLIFGYLIAIALLFLMARYNFIDFWDFGLNREAFRQGYFTAAAAALMFMVMTRGVPQQVSFNGIKSLTGLLFSVLIIGLARELIWRGFIQTTFSRKWGAAAGLILTALLAGLFHYITVTVSSPWMLSYPYTLVELLILVPGSAIVLGYLYLRTENILSCALLHGLILYLSSLIII